MSETKELRVGVCGCSPYYHGSLQARRIEVDGLSEAFAVREVLISGEDHCQGIELRRLRCHFFVDVHQEGSACGVFVNRIEPSFDPQGRPSGILIGWRPRPGGGGELIKREWHSENPPTIEEIVTSIGDLLRNMDDADLNRWLKQISCEV